MPPHSITLPAAPLAVRSRVFLYVQSSVEISESSFKKDIKGMKPRNSNAYTGPEVNEGELP